VTDIDLGSQEVEVEGAEPVTTAHETPLYLPAGDEHVFGIVTRPTVPPSGTAVLCLHAGARNMSRIYTRLCRESAGAGHTAVRMDFHGCGDSSGVLVDLTVSGQTMLDVDVAVRWLVDQGFQRVVVVGNCWGALVALVAASRHRQVVSACLISPPLGVIETGVSATKNRKGHDRLIRVLSDGLRLRVARMLVMDRRYRAWVAARVARRVSRSLPAWLGRNRAVRRADDHVEVSAHSLFAPLLRRRVPIRVLFGEQDSTYLRFREQSTRPSLAAASQILEVTVTPATVHGLPTLRSQETVLDFVRDCLARDAAAASGGRGAGLLVDD
jgi:pimeloyl-ACP methyl ester carboxylesterase